MDAPLNSRLVNNTTAAARQERLTTKRLRQLITKTDNDEDDESDLQQLEDEVPPEMGDDNEVKDDITRADLDIQEALLVEDLLSVLIVGSSDLTLASMDMFEHDLTFMPVLQGIDGQFIRQDVAGKLEDTAGDFSGSKYVIDEAIGG